MQRTHQNRHNTSYICGRVRCIGNEFPKVKSHCCEDFSKLKAKAHAVDLEMCQK